MSYKNGHRCYTRIPLAILFAWLTCFNSPVSVASCQEDFEVGDRVLIKRGSQEIEATVVDPDGFGGMIEVEYESHGFPMKHPIPKRHVKRIDSNDEVDNSPSMAKLRIWTDATGTHKIKAVLVSNENGKVELEKEDGRVVTLALEKLSQTDQDFLAEQARIEASENDPNNPFAGGIRTGNRNSKSRRRENSSSGKREMAKIEPELGTNIVDMFVDKWSYTPDAGSNNNKLRSIGYNIAAGEKPFFDRTTGLRFSLNRKSAAALITNSFNDEYSALVVFDLENGKLHGKARIPITEAEVLAISNDGTRVALIPNQIGSTKSNDGMTIWNLKGDNALQETAWKTAGFGERNGFKPTAGAFLGSGRLLTVGKNVILWDIETATDLYTIDRIEPSSITFSANNRRFAFQKGDKIVLADTLTGDCLGILDTSDSGKASMAFSQSGEFLAVLRWFSNEVRIWDLKNQEVVHEFTTKFPSFRSLNWVGDQYLLVNGMDLYDVALRVPVWRYLSGGIGNVAGTNDGRFWLLNKTKLKAVRIPEKNLEKRLSKIDPDSLLVMKPRDEVELEVKLPFPRSEQDEVYAHLASQLEGNGISIQQGAELKLVTEVKKLPKESMEVTSFFDPFARNGSEKISFIPSNVSVRLMRGEEVLWSRSSTFHPGTHFRTEDGESAQQAATRLCKADASFFKRVKIPKTISRLPGGKPLGQTNLSDF